MAEARTFAGRPFGILKSENEELGADVWYEKNTHRDLPVIALNPPVTRVPEDIALVQKGPTPGILSSFAYFAYRLARLEIIQDYGNYTRCNSVVDVMSQIAWQMLAQVIYEKVRWVLTGYGAPLCNDLSILIPLYFKHNKNGLSTMFFKTTRHPANEKTPFEALRDHLIASVGTLRYLRDNTTLPIPHVFMYFVEGPDLLKLNRPWCIIERMPGEPLKRLMAEMTLDRLEKIGLQLAALYSQLLRTRFNAIGSLRLWARGRKVKIGPIASDPNGQPLTTSHYKPRQRRLGQHNHPGYDRRVNRPYSTVADYFLHIGNAAVHSLLATLRDRPIRDLWQTWQYIHLRHLHLYMTEYLKTDLITNVFTLDTSALNLENIHIDDQCNISGILDWDGIAIKPIHLAMTLPSPLCATTSYWLPHHQSIPPSKSMTLKSTFEAALSKSLSSTGLIPLLPTVSPDLSSLWGAVAKGRDFERTMWFFSGCEGTDRIEWRAYMDFSDRKFAVDLGRYPDLEKDEVKDLVKMVKQKWACLEQGFEVPSVEGVDGRARLTGHRAGDGGQATIGRSRNGTFSTASIRTIRGTNVDAFMTGAAATARASSSSSTASIISSPRVTSTSSSAGTATSSFRTPSSTRRAPVTTAPLSVNASSFSHEASSTRTRVAFNPTPLVIPPSPTRIDSAAADIAITVREFRAANARLQRATGSVGTSRRATVRSARAPATMSSAVRAVGGGSAGSSTLRDVNEFGGWEEETRGLRSPVEMDVSSGFGPRPGRPRSFTEETRRGKVKMMKKAKKWSSSVVNRFF
jgi:hypothetical protein